MYLPHISNDGSAINGGGSIQRVHPILKCMRNWSYQTSLCNTNDQTLQSAKAYFLAQFCPVNSIFVDPSFDRQYPIIVLMISRQFMCSSLVFCARCTSINA